MKQPCGMPFSFGFMPVCIILSNNLTIHFLLSDINAFNAGRKRDKALELLSVWLPDVEKFSKEIGKQQAYRVMSVSTIITLSFLVLHPASATILFISFL